MCVQLEMCVLMQSVSLNSGNGMTTNFSRFTFYDGRLNQSDKE